jgi:hypothetical protein
VSEPLPPAVPLISPPSSPALRGPAKIALIAVLIAACLVAFSAYQHFLCDHRSLWYSNDHDRNAHYLYALKLAGALRGFRVVEFLHELNRAYIWPPLHGLLAAPLLAIKGFDYRLAVLPSLFGWIGTVVFAFLLARRCLPEWGDLAGLVAATFVLASPLHRGFATDIMLESLGACFTLLSLFLYVRTVQEGTLSCYRGLALGLTAFFVYKYNYWLLTVFAIVGAEILVRGAYYARTVRTVLTGIDWRAWLRGELRQPLSWLTALTLLLLGGIMLSGIATIQLAGRTIRTHPPTALVSLAYLFAVLRVAWWGWTHRAWLAGCDARMHAILFWHLCPVALFLALPRHFSTFLWYVSPNNAPAEHSTLWQGVQFYAPAAVEHYHVGPWSAFLAGGLCLVTLVAWRRLRPGAIAVVLLVLISAFLTCLHGNHQIRYLHNWIAALWVCGGIGAVTLVSMLSRPFNTRVSRVAVALAVLVLVVMHAPPIVQRKKSVIGGPWEGRASMLDVGEAICRESADAEQFTILTTVPFRFFAQWFLLEHPDAARKFEPHWWGYGQTGQTNRDGFRRWLDSTNCDTLVIVDGTPPDTSGANVEVQRHLALREQVLAQKTFHLVKEREFPGQGCRLLVYRRTERSGAAAGVGLSRSDAPKR